MFTAALKINQSFFRVVFSLFLTIIAFGVWAQPTFNSATVSNAIPNRVVVKFNMGGGGNMRGSTAATDFTVTVSGNIETIASYTILNVDGVPADEVWLNMTNPIPGGEDVTVAFNDASSDIRQYSFTGGTSSLVTFAAQTVTNSVNPTSVTAASLTNICSGTNSYFDLGNIVINEVEVHNFSTGTDVTLELDAPTNFEFQAGVGSVGYTGTDITAAAVVVTSTKITVTYTVGSILDVNSLTISGIKVKATAVSSSGSVLRTGGDAKQGGNKVADAVVHASLSSDANPCPEVTTYSPAKLATGVTISDDIVLTFNTNVVSSGSGNITITPISPAGTDIVIPITDPQVTIGGGSSTVTINPTSDLAVGTQYEVKVDQGAIVGDGTSAPFVGITAGEWTFTTADVALTLNSTSPVDDAVDVVQSTNIVLTYSTNIGVGTGNITIRNLTTNTDIFDAPASDGQITIVGNVLTIDLSANLNPNTEYRVRMGGGVITRLSDGAAGPSITGSNLTFKTDINLVSVSPTNGTVDVPVNQTLTVTYDANVTDGTGNIILRDLTTPSTSNIAPNLLDYSGTNTAVRTSPGLNPNTLYEIEIPAGVIVADGGAGSTVPAVAANVWRFTTESGITGTPNSPTDNANNVAVGTTSLIIDYSANVAKGASGTIVVQAVGGGTQNIDVTTGAVTVSGNQVTITVSALAANTEYRVAIPKGAFVAASGAGADVPQIAAADWNFTTASTISISSTSPADDATNVAINSDLVITFSGNVIAAGSGDITIENVTDGGSQTVAIGSASIVNNVVTIPNAAITTPLLANTDYRVTFNDGVLLDATSPNGHVTGITNGNNWSFKTVSGVTITPPFVPAHNATNVALDANFEITFSENISRGMGNLYVKEGAGTPVAYDITNTTIFTFPSPNVLRVNLPTDLSSSATYEITMDAGALVATARAQAGVPAITAGTWQFTTVGGVTITAPPATLCIDADFVTLDPIVLTESSTSTFATNTGQTLILSLPSNYLFETTSGSVITTGSEIANANLVVGATSLTLTYDISGTAIINSIIINGLRVKATAGAASGNLTRTGGTASQQGSSNGTVHASFTTATRPSAPMVSSPTFSYCQAEVIGTASVTASGGGTYHWYSDAALTTEVFTGASPQLAANLGVTTTNAGVTTFYVTRDDGTCESTSTTVTVTINEKPVVSLISSDADNILCADASVPIIFTAIASPSAGANYDFQLDGNSQQSGTSNVFSTTADLLSTGTVTVVVTTPNSCVTPSAGIGITVNNLPNLNYIDSTVTSFPLDQTDPVPLVGASFGPTLDGTLQASGVGTFSGDGIVGENFYPNVMSEGDHIITYTYTDPVTSCTNSTTFTLNVYNPDGAVDGLANAYCIDASTTGNLTPTTDLGIFPNTFTRSQKILTGFSGGFPPKPQFTTYVATYTKPTAYTMFKTGGAGILNFSGGNYTFTPDNGGGGVGNVDISVRYLYTRTGVSPSGGSAFWAPFFPNNIERVRSSRTVVNPLPVLALEGVTEGEKLCFDKGTVTLRPLSSGTEVNSSFTIKYIKSPSVTPVSLASKSFNTATLGTGSFRIFVEYTDPSTGCSNNSDTTNFTINALPVTTLTIPKTLYCVTDAQDVITVRDGAAVLTDLSTVTFEIDKGSGYQANGGEIVLDLASSPNVARMDPSVMGVFDNIKIRATYINVDGCSDLSNELTINVKALPIPQLINLNASGYCINASTQTVNVQDNGSNFIINTSTNNVVFQVDTTGNGFTPPRTGSIILSNGTNNVTLDPTKFPAGNHQIRYYYRNGNGCVDTMASTPLIIHALPTLNFTGLGATYCNNDNDITLNAFADGATLAGDLANVTFYISDNGGTTYSTATTAQIEVNSVGGTITFKPKGLTASTAYKIYFTYTDGNSCLNSSAVEDVFINPIPNLGMTITAGVTTYCEDAGNIALTLTDATAGLTLNNNPGNELNNVVFQIQVASAGAYVDINNGAVTINATAPTAAQRVILDTKVMGDEYGKDATHNIRYYYKDANGCTDTLATVMAITINSKPVPTIDNATFTGQYCHKSTTTENWDLEDKGGAITINTAAPNVVFEIDLNRTGTYNTTDLPAGAITLNNGADNVTFNPKDLPVGSHNIRFRYTDGNTCDSVSTAYAIEIIALPSLSLTGLSSTYCANDGSVALTAENNGNDLLNKLSDVEFFIKKGAGAFAAAGAEIDVDDAGKKITFKPASLTAGNYQITFRYIDNDQIGCVNFSDTLSFVINPTPDLNLALPGGITAFCESVDSVAISLTNVTTGNSLNDNLSSALDRVTFIVDRNQAGNYVVVSGEVVKSGAPANPAERIYLRPIIMAQQLGTGTHDLSVVYTDGNGCTDTLTTPIPITIYPLPVPVIVGLATGYCINASTTNITLQDGVSNINIGASNVTFEIDYNRTETYTAVPANSFILSLGTNNVTFDPTKITTIGQHDVRFKYTDGNGCENYSIDYPLEIFPLPNLTFTGLSTEYCFSDGNVSLSAFNNGANLLNDLANVNFFISSNNGASFSPAPVSLVEVNAAAQTITFKPSDLAVGTNYQLKFEYTDGNTCKTESPAIAFVVHPLPQPKIATIGGGAVTQFCEKDPEFALTFTDNQLGTTLNNNAGGELSRITLQVRVNSTGTFRNMDNSEVRVVQGDPDPTKRIILNPVAMALLGKDQIHQIRYIYVNANNCTSISDTANIRIWELPVPTVVGLNAAASTGYCTDASTATLTLQDDGSNITINTATNNVVFEIDPGRTGTYTTTLPTGSITLNNGTNQVTLDPTKIPVGTYNIRYKYTDGNTCEEYSVDYPIEIYPLPSLKIIGMSTAYCIDNPDITLRAENNGNDLLNDLGNVNFTISTNGGAFNAPGGAVVVDPTAKTITFKPSQLAANNYRIRYFYTDANACDDYSDTLSFVINPLPDPTITVVGGVTAYCEDHIPVALTLRDITTTTILNDNTGSELDRVTFQVQTNSVGAYQNVNGEVSIVPAGATSADRVLMNPVELAKLGKDQTHNIRFRYVDANGCEQTSAPTSITIFELPVPVINGIDATGYCESETSGTLTLQDDGANITINTMTNNVVFEVDTTGAGFTPPPTGGLTLVHNTNQVIINPNKFPIGVHRIRFTYTDGNGCVQTSNSAITFEVLKLPTLTFTGLSATYCNDDAQVQLRAFNNGNVLSPPNGAFTLSTDNATFAANSAIDANTHILDPTKLTPGIYWIRYEFTDASLCNNISASQQFEVYFSPGRDLDFTFTNTCFGDSVRFNATASGITGQWKWEWDFGDGVTDTIQNPNHAFPTFATFQVTLKATSQNGCSFTIVKTVTTTPVPTADFGSAGFCLGSPTQFTDQSTVSQPGLIVRWFWDFGDGNTSTLQNPSHTYAAAGTYNVTLRVETQGSITSCTNTITKTVYIFPYVIVTSTSTYLENFEANDGGWIAYGTNSSWQHGTPAGSTFDATSGRVWATNLTGTYNNNESSWVESPCFNIDGMSKPVVNLKYWTNTDINFDGAVLLVTLDDGVTWEVLGRVGTGIDWYNKTGILGNPGQQSAAQSSWNGNIIGWAGDTDTTWKVAKFPLDLIKTRLDFDPNDNLKTIRFRVAFGSDASSQINSQLDGFGFDEFFIGERNRVALLEHFTNSSNATANTENAYVDSVFTSSDPEVVKIEFHTKFPGDDVLNQDNNAAPSARALYYGVAVTPRTVLDGVAKDSAFSTYGEDDYSRRTLIASPFNINMDFAGSTPTSLNVQATVSALNNSVTGPLIIHVVVIERVITGVGTTGLTFRNVVKKMLPSAAGTLVDWTSGKASEVITQTWTLDKIYDNKQVAVVVFVQDDLTKEVYQAAIGDPTSFLRTDNGGGNQADPGKVTGIADDLERDFIVYPNPATTKVYVGYKSYVYKEDTPFRVYDQLGKVITSGVVQKGKNGVVINTQQWAEGVYYVELTASDGSKTRSKIVKH